MGSYVTCVFTALQDFLLKLQGVGCVSHAALSLVVPPEEREQGPLADCIRDLLHTLELQLNVLQEESSKTCVVASRAPVHVVPVSSIQDVSQCLPKHDVTDSIKTSTSFLPSATTMCSASSSTPSGPDPGQGKIMLPVILSSLQECESKQSYREKEKRSHRESFVKNVTVDVGSPVELKRKISVRTHCEAFREQESIIFPGTFCKKPCSKPSPSIPPTTCLEINFCTCMRLSEGVSSTTGSAARVSPVAESIQSPQLISLKTQKKLSNHSLDGCLLRNTSGCLKTGQNNRAKVVLPSQYGCSTVSTFTSPGLAEALLGLSSSSTANSGYVSAKRPEVSCLETSDKRKAVEVPELPVTIAQKNLSSSDACSSRTADLCPAKCCEISSCRVVASPSTSGLLNRDANEEASDKMSIEQQILCIQTFKSIKPVVTPHADQRLCDRSGIYSASSLGLRVTSAPSSDVAISTSVVVAPHIDTICPQTANPVDSSTIQFQVPLALPCSSLLLPPQGPPYSLSPSGTSITPSLSSPSPFVRLGNTCASLNDPVQLNSFADCTPTVGVLSALLSNSSQTPELSSHALSCTEQEHDKSQSTSVGFLTPASMVTTTHECLRQVLPIKNASKVHDSRPLCLALSGVSDSHRASTQNRKVTGVTGMVRTGQYFQPMSENKEKLEYNTLNPLDILAVLKSNSLKITRSSAQLQATIEATNTILVPTHCRTTHSGITDTESSDGPRGYSGDQTDLKRDRKVPSPQRSLILQNNVSKEVSYVVSPSVVQCPEEITPSEPSELPSSMNQPGEIPAHTLTMMCPPRTTNQMILCSESIRTIDALTSEAAIPSIIDQLPKPLTHHSKNVTSNMYFVSNRDADNTTTVVQAPYFKTGESTLIPNLKSATNPENNCPIYTTLQSTVFIPNATTDQISGGTRQAVLQYAMGSLAGSYPTMTPVPPHNPGPPTTLPATADRGFPPPPAEDPPLNSCEEPSKEPLLELPVFCCKVCSVACPSMEMFSGHACRVADDAVMEEDEPDGEPPPIVCSRTLITSEVELRQVRRFTCAVCGLEFRALRRIVCHLTRCRMGPYPCPACGALYITRTALHHHMKTQHRREKCHACPECGKSFERRTSLEKHLIMWHEDAAARGPFRCDACPKKFIRRIYLTNHKLRMHKLDKKFLCQCCGRRFLGAASLSVHEREAHGPTPRSFACTLCDKTFVKKEKLVFHLRWHSGERPFVCTVCGLGFVSTSKLNEHKIRRHQPAHARRRYHCPHCDKSYANCSDLKKHARRIHASELTPTQCIPSIASVKVQQQLDSTEPSISDPCRVDHVNDLVAPENASNVTRTIAKNKKSRNRTSTSKAALHRMRKRGSCDESSACGPVVPSERQVLLETKPRLSTTNLPINVQEVTLVGEHSQPGSLTGEVTCTTQTSPPPLPVQHHQLMHQYHEQQQPMHVSSNTVIPHLVGDQPQQQQVYCSLPSMLPQTLPALFHVLQHSSQNQQQLQGLSMPPSFNTYIGAGHPSSATSVEHPGLHSVASAVNVSATPILDGGNTMVLYSNASVVLPSSVVMSPSLFHHTVGTLANSSHINGTVVMPGGQTSILLSGNGNCSSSNNNSVTPGLPNSLSLLPGAPNVLVPAPGVEYTSTSHHQLQHHRQSRVYEFIPSVDVGSNGSALPSVLSSSLTPVSPP